MELAQLDDLPPPLFALLGSEDDRRLRRVPVRFIVVVLGPFFLKLGKKLEIVGELGRNRGAGGRLLGCFQFGGESGERTGDGVGGAGEQLAKHQRHELTLAGGKGVEVWLLEVFGDEIVEPLLLRAGNEFLHKGVAFGVGDILEHLAAEGALAERLQTIFKPVVLRRCAFRMAELRVEAAEVAEGELVDDADEAIELLQGVLEGRGRQQQLVAVGEGSLDGFADLVAGFVDVAEAVGLVDDDQVPLGLRQIRLFGAGELVGADDDPRMLERVQIARTNGLLEGLRFQDGGGKEELVGELLAPLLSEVRRTDDE